MFQLLFERSADAIWLYEPQSGVFVDCNQAAVRLMRAGTKENLLRQKPEDLSPALQPDGTSSPQKAAEVSAITEKNGGHHFEWLARRLDGEEVPLEVSATPILDAGRHLHVIVSRDITERKRAEADLRKLNESLERRIAERTAELTASEARLWTLVEYAPEAIVVFDGDTGRFLSTNPHACRLYGRTAEELTRLTPMDVSPEFQPDGTYSADLAREKMREALAGGVPVFEWTHRQATGRLIPTEVRLVRLPSEGRNLIRASIIDNTERKRHERVQMATYEISEAALTADDLDSLYRRIHGIVKGLMPAQNFYIALLNPDTNRISFPYHVDEVTPHPEPCELGTGLTGYVFRLGKPLLVGAKMNSLKRRDGQTVTFEGYSEIRYVEYGIPAAIWLGVPLSTGGAPFGVMAVQDYRDPNAYGEAEEQLLSFVARQIATAIERKRVEQALRDSEAKFRALFAASSQGVMLHDEKRYLEVNPAAVRVLGYRTPEELRGKSPGDTSPPFQPNGERSDVLADRYIAECMAKGSARFDWVARTPRGEDVPLEVMLTRIDWGGRRIIQSVLYDLTERKKAETELLKALAREKELGQLKSNFVSMVSHEFRTPLGVIVSSADILDSYFDRLEPAERREQLQSIQKSAKHMAGLMEEALLLGMVEAGKLDFKPAPVDLGALCQRIVNEVLSAAQHKCPIELSAADDLPPALADARLLIHILTNLLNNAVKYSQEQSPVRLEIQREGRTAICRVRDRGMGIPKEDMPRLFDAFHRAANAAHMQGSGLGLTIVKRCVELHKGQIEIESALGEGTTASVRLPLFPS